MALDELLEGCGGDACRPSDADDLELAGGDQFVHGAAAEAKRIGCLSDREQQADRSGGGIHAYLKPLSTGVRANLLLSL